MFNLTPPGDDTKSKGQQKKNVLQYLKRNHSKFQDDFLFLMCVCEQSIVYKSKGKSNFQAQHTRMGPNIINVSMEWSSPCPLLCWVRRQMCVLCRARQGSQDNGQRLCHFDYSKILGGRINNKKKENRKEKQIMFNKHFGHCYNKCMIITERLCHIIWSRKSCNLPR